MLEEMIDSANNYLGEKFPKTNAAEGGVNMPPP